MNVVPSGDAVVYLCRRDPSYVLQKTGEFLTE